MDPILTRDFRIRIHETDWTGRATPVALLNFLQDAAYLHAAGLGVGVPELRRRGLTWVLSRLLVRFDDFPAAHETVQVRTWPSSREGRSTTRDFEIVAADGRPLSVATSAWALLDLESKRPVRLAGALPDYPLHPRRTLDFPPAKVPPLDGSDRELPFRVRLADLDINRHVNNTVYVEWGIEAVPAEVVERCRPWEIEIAFRAEAFYSAVVLSRLQPVSDGREPAFLHQLVSREEGTELARLRTIWRPFPIEEKKTPSADVPLGQSTAF